MISSPIAQHIKIGPAEDPVVPSIREKLRIEYWPVERLKPYERNPRKNDQAVDRIRASIREFGFAVPILAKSNGEVVDGHLRLKGAIAEKIREVPVIPCDGWTDAQVKAFRLLSNRSVSWAEWDLDALVLEFGELKALEFDLSLTGFDMRELDSLLRDPSMEENADQAPPLPEIAVTQPGDLWLCGPHRVLCGDATVPDAVSRVCALTKPFVMTTDPPYGVNYDPMWREEAGLGHQRQTGKVTNDDRVDWTDAYSLFLGDVAYVWHGGVHAGEVASNLAAVGFEIRAQLIWSKQHFAMSRGNYHWQHEPCWYAVRKGRRSNWNGDRTQSTIWQVQNLNPMGGDRNEIATGHGTQKPVELFRRPIVNHTKSGDSVYDPFLGSGTAMMAAELTERICCGIDIDPRYVDVSALRWQQFTGKEATLDGDGRTFEQIKAERVGVAA
jgi:DNA modification methylase